MVKFYKIKKITWILLTVALVIFVVLTYAITFVIVRPFMGVITDGKPIIKYLCEMQEECQSVVGPYTCSFNENVNPESEVRLSSWKGYYGCNESTPSYYIHGIPKRMYGGVVVEYCSCGGLM